MIRAMILPLLTAAAAAAAAAPPLAVGVPEFAAEGYGAAGVAAAARGLVEDELSRSGRIALVERSRLADVLTELGFQQSGATAPEGVAAAGRTANVQLLLFGQVSRLSAKEFRLTMRAVDVATGRVVRSEALRLPAAGPAFDKAVRTVARRLAGLSRALAPAPMVQIPGGTLMMGSRRLPEEGPVHAVAVEPFALDRTEVSGAAFALYAEAIGRAVDPSADPDAPATGVSWEDAAGYCGWVGKRLPTEAEWEMAARGAAGRTYPWGEAEPSPDRARFGGAAPVAVDALPAGATPEGVLHLAGNVGEWVADWWDPSYYGHSPSQAPPGPASGEYRVVRGGGHTSAPDELRGAARAFHTPVRGGPDTGFRCAAAAGTP